MLIKFYYNYHLLSLITDKSSDGNMSQPDRQKKLMSVFIIKEKVEDRFQVAPTKEQGINKFVCLLN